MNQLVTNMKCSRDDLNEKSINKRIVVLIPTYAVAYPTDKMVYVVPMLAAMGFVAASLFEDNTTQTYRR